MISPLAEQTAELRRLQGASCEELFPPNYGKNFRFGRDFLASVTGQDFRRESP